MKRSLSILVVILSFLPDVKSGPNTNLVWAHNWCWMDGSLQCIAAIDDLVEELHKRLDLISDLSDKKSLQTRERQKRWENILLATLLYIRNPGNAPVNKDKKLKDMFEMIGDRKKNKFMEWTGKSENKPILKGNSVEEFLKKFPQGIFYYEIYRLKEKYKDSHLITSAIYKALFQGSDPCRFLNYLLQALLINSEGKFLRDPHPEVLVEAKLNAREGLCKDIAHKFYWRFALVYDDPSSSHRHFVGDPLFSESKPVNYWFNDSGHFHDIDYLSGTVLPASAEEIKTIAGLSHYYIGSIPGAIQHIFRPSLTNMLTYEAYDYNFTQKRMYELFAVLLMDKEAIHVTAFVKADDGAWYYYDDMNSDRVKVSEETVNEVALHKRAYPGNWNFYGQSYFYRIKKKPSPTFQPAPTKKQPTSHVPRKKQPLRPQLNQLTKIKQLLIQLKAKLTQLLGELAALQK
jgi:hypothetical protein